MAYEHKAGDFTLFKNDKGDNPKRPDYTGSGVNLDGSKIKISAWIKEGGKGKFMSCRIQTMTQGEPAPQAETRKPAGKSAVADLEDDLPFASCELGDDVIYRKLRWGVE